MKTQDVLNPTHTAISVPGRYQAETIAGYLHPEKPTLYLPEFLPADTSEHDAKRYLYDFFQRFAQVFRKPLPEVSWKAFYCLSSAQSGGELWLLDGFSVIQQLQPPPLRDSTDALEEPDCHLLRTVKACFNQLPRQQLLLQAGDLLLLNTRRCLHGFKYQQSGLQLLTWGFELKSR